MYNKQTNKTQESPEFFKALVISHKIHTLCPVPRDDKKVSKTLDILSDLPGLQSSQHT